jgi:hypothetical protein
LLEPGGIAKLQSQVVDIASATKGLRQLRRLLVGRKESVHECLKRYHRTILQSLSVSCNQLLIVCEAPTMRNSSPSKPSALDGVFFRGFDKWNDWGIGEIPQSALYSYRRSGA